MHVSSGFKELDIILEGGFFTKRKYLFIENTTVSFLADAIASANAKEFEVIYILPNDSIKGKIEKAKYYNFELKDVKFITFRPFEKNGITSLALLNEISIAVEEKCERAKKPVLLIISDFQTFFMYHQSEQLFKFLMHLFPKIREKEGTMMVFSSPEIERYGLLKSIFDAIYRLKEVENKQIIMTGPGIPLEVTFSRLLDRVAVV